MPRHRNRGAAAGMLVLAMGVAAISLDNATASATTSGRSIVTATPPSTETADVVYSCDMSAYGGTSPVDVTMPFTVQTSVTAGESAPVALSSLSVTFPASVSANATMQTATGFTFTGVASIDDAGLNQTATLTPTTTPEVLIHPTGIPATLPFSRDVPFPRAGTARITPPPTVVITPSNAQGTSLTPIQCTLASSPVTGFSISVNPPSPAPAYSGAILLKLGLCLDDRGNSSKPGAIVQVWQCNALPNQRWQVMRNGTIQHNGLCLDARGGGTKPGTKVDMWTCTGGANQRWDTTGWRVHYDNPAASRQVLDDTAFGGNGTQQEIYTSNGGANQIWSTF